MKYSFIVSALLFFTACGHQKMEYEYKWNVVNAKVKVKENGDDKFLISFSDGQSEYCSFGEYNKYKVGDTLRWEREKHFFGFWYLQTK